jgi:hypothetical protein
MIKDKGESGNILVNTDGREICDLKEIRHDLDLPSQFAKMSAFFKVIQLETSEFPGDMSSHDDSEILEMGNE